MALAVPGATGVLRLIAVLWGLGLMALPLFNHQRRRAGDFVAGTIVISTAVAILDRDLAHSKATQQKTRAHSFTPQELTHYGERELHVLEEMLRQPAADRREATRVVAERIRKKLWRPRSAAA